jgi:O-antigen/teichoic acid export membrane protein
MENNKTVIKGELNTSDKKVPPSSPFSKNVFTLASGTTIAQIITILSSPIVTRLYGPDAFGLFALFTSIISIFAIIACFRYELAIMLPKTNEEAANIFGLCLLIVIFISFLSIPIFILYKQFPLQFLNTPQIEQFFWFIPLSIFINGIYLALDYWNSRTKLFYRSSIARIFKSFSSSGIQIGAGSVGYTSGEILIGANIIGQLISTLVLGIQILKNQLSFFIRVITWQGMLDVAKRYSKFPKYDIWSALINTISGMLPIFILSAYFNSTIVGFYALGLMVLQLPLGIIGSSIAQVFFQKAAEAKNISLEKLKIIVEKTIKPLIFLCVFPVILLMIIGPEIFSVVFGIRWEESGNYVRYLSFWIGMVFITSPISTLFTIFQKQRFTLFFNILQLMCRIIALLIGVIIGEALISIILFAVVSAFFYVIAYIYLLRLAGVSILLPAVIAKPYFMLSVPFIIVILIFQRLFFSNILLVVFLSTVLSSIYYLIAIKRDPEILSTLKSINSQIPIIKKYL